jgi:hypothetical protein
MVGLVLVLGTLGPFGLLRVSDGSFCPVVWVFGFGWGLGLLGGEISRVLT